MSKFKPNYRLNGTKQLERRTENSPVSGSARTAVLSPSAPELETVSVSPGSVAEPEAQPSPLTRIGFYATLVYLFFRFSFLHEFITNKLNIDTHIIITVSLVCYVCCLLSGRLSQAFRDKITWMWLGFGACMSIATATSFWLGGSFMILMDFIRTVLPIIIMIPAFTTSKKDVGKIVSVIGLACVTTVFLGLANNDFKTGRMSIDAVGSDIQDSNDYAAHLILMLPALAYLLARPGKSMGLKILGIALIGVSMYEVLSTGSRGGLLSLGLTALYIAFTGSHKLKVGILVGIPVLGLLAIPFIPQESASRLQTLFSSSNNSKAEEASESSQARLALLEESMKISAQHPLFGVGPGEFMDFQGASAKEEGHRGMWHVTHNAYSQVASECGLPALFLYLGAIICTFAAFRKGFKSGDPDLALPSAVLGVMLVSFSICVFFLSLAYNPQIVALGGIAVSVRSFMKEKTVPEKRLAA